MEFLIIGAIALFGVFTFMKTDAPLAPEDSQPKVAQEHFYHPSKDQVAEADRKLEEARRKEFEVKKLKAELAEAEAQRKQIEEAEKARVAFEKAEQARREEAARRAEQARRELEQTQAELARKKMELENPDLIRKQVRSNVTTTTLEAKFVEPAPIVEAHSKSEVESALPKAKTTHSEVSNVTETPLRSPASNEKLSTESVLTTSSQVGWSVQVASHRSPEEAKSDLEKAKSKGHPAFIEEATVGSSMVYRVKIGPTSSKSEAEALKDSLRDIPEWSKGFVTRSKSK